MKNLALLKILRSSASDLIIWHLPLSKQTARHGHPGSTYPNFPLYQSMAARLTAPVTLIKQYNSTLP